MQSIVHRLHVERPAELPGRFIEQAQFSGAHVQCLLCLFSGDDLLLCLVVEACVLNGDRRLVRKGSNRLPRGLVIGVGGRAVYVQ